VLFIVEVCVVYCRGNVLQLRVFYGSKVVSHHKQVLEFTYEDLNCKCHLVHTLRKRTWLIHGLLLVKTNIV